jgi:hypothetical protein
MNKPKAPRSPAPARRKPTALSLSGPTGCTPFLVPLGSQAPKATQLEKLSDTLCRRLDPLQVGHAVGPYQGQWVIALWVPASISKARLAQALGPKHQPLPVRSGQAISEALLVAWICQIQQRAEALHEELLQLRPALAGLGQGS